MGDRNNVYYNYYPHSLLNGMSTDDKKKKQMATQFINLITSKHHSYKETEAHLVSTKGGQNISAKSILGNLGFI